MVTRTACTLLARLALAALLVIPSMALAAAPQLDPADPHRLTDGGPVYTETNLNRWLVEPWNAASNLVFLAVVLFWASQVYRAPAGRHGFIKAALPILFIGFVGGTMYHAFRMHRVWLLMDWMPILILALAVSVRYGLKLRLGWPRMLLFYLLPIALLMAVGFTLRQLLEVDRKIFSATMPALGYTTMALWILIPLVLYLRRVGSRNRDSILLALGCFLVAITARTLDRFAPWPFQEHGTHFLWHAFGALAANFVIRFMYREDRATAPAQPAPPHPTKAGAAPLQA